MLSGQQRERVGGKQGDERGGPGEERLHTMVT